MGRSGNVALALALAPAIACFLCVAVATGSARHEGLPISVKAFENETLLLPCDPPDSDGDGGGVRSTTLWYKDGELVADRIQPRYAQLRNSSLLIADLTVEDAGEYKCEVARPDLAPVQQVYTIKVLSPPTIETNPSSGLLVVGAGQEVDISCEAKGFPVPVIRWSREGEVLDLLDNRPRLRFNATGYNSSGVYECQANNDIGPPAKASIKVIVQGPPLLKAEKHWVHTGLGMRAKLVAWVVSVPAAKGDWHHEGIQVRTGSRIVIYSAEDESSVLMIRNVRAADLGTYTFKAQNKMGMASVSFKLSGVAAEADFIVDQKINNASKTSFTLKWQVFSYTSLIEYNLWFRPYKPKPEPMEDGFYMREKDTTWTKLTIPVDDNAGPVHIGSYTINGLKPETVYEALITSRNRFGWSKPSRITHFATSPTDDHRHTVDLEDARDDFRRQPFSSSPAPVNATTTNSSKFEYKAREFKYGNAARHAQSRGILLTFLTITLAINL